MTDTFDSTTGIVEPRFERLLVLTAEQALEATPCAPSGCREADVCRTAG
jgi:hypothetical protein